MPKIIAKPVSNYELFYDLVFVLAIARLTHFLHMGHFELGNFLAFVASTGLVLSIWTYQTFYSNKYSERSPLDVYLNIPAMFIMGNFALMLGLENFNRRGFILYNSLMIAAHLLIVVQYVLKGRQIGFNADIRASIKSLILTVIYFLGLFLAGAIFHLYSVGNRYTSLLWIVAWLFPLLVRSQIDSNRINFPHLVERFQLITIITFGETVVGLIQAYPLYQHPLLGLLFFTGISFMFVAYITQTHINMDHHRETLALRLMYSHLLLIIAINMVTAGLEIVAETAHRNQGMGLLLAGLLAFYSSLYFLSAYNHDLYRFGRHYYLFVLLLLCLAGLTMWLLRSRLLLVALILAVTCFAVPRLNFFLAGRRQKEKQQA